MSDTTQPTQPGQPEQSDAQILANTCLHCSKTREQHGETGLCLAAGYYGNHFTPSLNATITVAFGDATPLTITLDGTELSTDSNGDPYLGNASREHIAEQVERALITLVARQDG